MLYTLLSLTVSQCLERDSDVIINNDDADFRDCIKIRSVTVSDSVTRISDNAFSKSSITSITLSNTVTSIGSNAFFACKSLKQVTLGSSVKTIGESAFASTALTEVIIPKSVETIGNFSFNECYRLEKVTLGSSVKTIGESAFDFTALTEVIIPDSVETIGNFSFYECGSLKKVTLGSSVKTIGGAAFASTALTEVTIPKSVETIGDFAFSAKKMILQSFVKFNFSQTKIIIYNVKNDSGSSKSIEFPEIYCENSKIIEILSLGGDCTIGQENIKSLANIKIYIEKDVKSIDDEAFSDVNIDIFAYFGTNELEGNFLANAKSIRGVIASTNYQGDSIGGVKITKKVPSYNIEEDNTNYELAKSAGLSGGAIAGIVIGVIVVIAIIAVVCFFIIRSKTKKSEDTAGNDV